MFILFSLFNFHEKQSIIKSLYSSSQLQVTQFPEQIIFIPTFFELQYNIFLMTQISKSQINKQVQGAKSNSNTNLKSRFQTQNEAFDITYVKLDHGQKTVCENILNRFIEAITKNYKQNPRPISIVDICCGYGKQTIKMRQKLLKNGVQIEKMVGYDISKDMIEYAQKNYTFPQVRFQVKNIQTEFNDIEQYDAALCLFGINWMNDIDGAVAAMHCSLKKGGLFSSKATVQVKDFYDLRQNFMLHSSWSSAFDQPSKILTAFAFGKEEYLSVLEKYFKTNYEELKITPLPFDRQGFITCCQSWFQEVRHLTKEVSHEKKKIAIGKAYLQDFYNSIEKNLNGSIIIKEDGSVIHTYYLYEYEGVKI